MRVLIVSDTHRQGGNFYRALEETKPVSLVIHCGDVEGQEHEFEAAVREANNCPFVIAAGNNDFFSNLVLSKLVGVAILCVLIEIMSMTVSSA